MVVGAHVAMVWVPLQGDDSERSFGMDDEVTPSGETPGTQHPALCAPGALSSLRQEGLALVVRPGRRSSSEWFRWKVTVALLVLVSVVAIIVGLVLLVV